MNRHAGRLAGALIVIALAGCTTSNLTPAARLEGTAWRAENIDGKPALDVQHQSTLRFFDRQLAGGSLGCNAYSTTYFADAAGLRFGGIAPTNNTCPPAVMEQEARFTVALEATRKVRHDADGALLLLDVDGKIRAKLTPLMP